MADFSQPICADYVVAIKRPDVYRSDRKGRLFRIAPSSQPEYVQAFCTGGGMRTTVDLREAHRFTRADAFKAAERVKDYDCVGDVELAADKGTYAFSLRSIEKARQRVS